LKLSELIKNLETLQEIHSDDPYVMLGVDRDIYYEDDIENIVSWKNEFNNLVLEFTE
jgi:hypothetical protein